MQEDFRAFLNAHLQPQAGPPVTNGDKPAAGAADPFEAELAAAAAAAGSAIEMAGSGGAGGAISQKTGAKPRRTSVRDKARLWLHTVHSCALPAVHFLAYVAAGIPRATAKES